MITGGYYRVSEKILANKGKKSRYPRVALSYNQTEREFLVHRLVALAFLQEPNAGDEVCHNDGDFNNNSVDNLRWGSKASNQQDRVKHGTDVRGTKHPVSKLTDVAVIEIRNLSHSGMKQADIGNLYGVSQATVSRIVLKKAWEWL